MLSSNKNSSINRFSKFSFTVIQIPCFKMLLQTEEYRLQKWTQAESQMSYMLFV